MNEMLQIVLDATRRMFEDYCGREVMERAEQGEWPRQLWDKLVETGITAATLPEERGGAGLSFEEAAAIMRLAGYYAVPIPLVETLAAGWMFTELGIDSPGGPLSLAADRRGPTLTATERGSNWILEGLCERVPWAARASGVVAAVATEYGEQLVCLDPKGAECAVGANLAFEPRTTLRITNLSLPAEALYPLPRAMPGLLMLGALLRVQQMAGAVQRALDLSTEYAGERVQFGRPIAKFQAIQQQLAVMAGQVAATNAAADAALAAWGTDKAAFSVAVAKARAGEAAGQVAAIAHQVHGAMGFTREHLLHYSTRRLWSWRDEFGNETFWQQWLGKRVLELGADGLWPFLVRHPRSAAEGSSP